MEALQDQLQVAYSNIQAWVAQEAQSYIQQQQLGSSQLTSANSTDTTATDTSAAGDE